MILKCLEDVVTFAILLLCLLCLNLCEECDELFGFGSFCFSIFALSYTVVSSRSCWFDVDLVCRIVLVLTLVSFELRPFVSICRTNEVLERFCCLLAMFLLLVYFVVRLGSKECLVIARKDLLGCVWSVCHGEHSCRRYRW